MYYEHFGLKEPPFKITPNTDIFFTGGNRGAVLDAMTYAILNGEGIVKVVGEVGSGKTMLCRMLQTMLPEHVESIYLANPSVAPEDVLHAIAFELQLRLPKTADRLKVMQALQQYLLKRHAAGKQVVIFVEEAQGMPLATLEEIRLLSNLETNHDKLLQIVLFGQPELDENLNEVNIRQLRERITHSFNLSPLEAKEIGEYIQFRLRAAGYFGPPLFTPAAIKKLANAAQGLVRRVNILADKAMLAAFSENGYQVTPKHVQAAISDSAFNAERVKITVGSNKWLWLAIVLLSLALMFFAGYWYKNNAGHQFKTATVEKEPVTNDSQVTRAHVDEAAEKMLPDSEQAHNQAAQLEQKQAVVSSSQPSANISQDNDILTQRLSAAETWLASQASSTVSIQIMGGKESPQLKADLEALSRKVAVDHLYVYRTQVNGQPFLNVLYGSFLDMQSAKTALAALSVELQKNKPQLRTVGGVLQEIRQLP